MIISWVQSMAMLSFVSIPFLEPLSFVMQSFTPYMFFVMISKAYKAGDSASIVLLKDDYYRL
jgi:hypothetical protein